MARPTLDVFVDLNRIICHDEGDGWGSAEPYLWTVFFRIGGSDVTLVFDGIDLSVDPPKPRVHLEGTPFVDFGPGSHGNLGDTDVDEGDVVPIPTALGEFRGLVTPIAIPEDLRELAETVGEEVPDDLPGFVGVAVVLMEEDNVSDAGAEAGHSALNSAIRDRIQQIIDTRDYDNSGVTQAEIDALTTGIDDVVSDAIREQQSIFEDIWSFLNKDDKIGHRVFVFNTDDLADQASIPLNARWRNHGDWELQGELIPSVVCPADAVASVIEATERAPGGFRYDRSAVQRFRDHEVMRYNGAMHWWEIVRKNKGRLLSLILQDREARDLTFDLLNAAQTLVKDPEQRVPDESLDSAMRLLELARQSKSRRLRVDASRAREAIERVRGKTVREALKVLDQAPPVRYPGKETALE